MNRDWTITVLVLITLFCFLGLMLYGNYQLCSFYYPDVNVWACMASNKSAVPIIHLNR